MTKRIVLDDGTIMRPDGARWTISEDVNGNQFELVLCHEGSEQDLTYYHEAILAGAGDRRGRAPGIGITVCPGASAGPTGGRKGNEMEGYKTLTSDYRPPLQGGEPVWDGTPDALLPSVALDRSGQSCAPGWHFCRNAADALRIGGLWSDGYPSVLVRVRAEGEVIERGDKCRTDLLRIVRACTDDEVQAGIKELSAPFAPHVARMVDSQMAWRTALARPEHDVDAVQAGLTEALDARGRTWTLQSFHDAQATQAAWAAWAARDTWATRNAWAAWATWATWAAWAARDTWATRNAWAAWAARDTWAAWAARDTWDAWDAWNALAVEFAALQPWSAHAPDLLTRGIRDAYRAGLAIAIPVAPSVLGWAMVDEGRI